MLIHLQFSSYGRYCPWYNGTEGAKSYLLQYGPCVSGSVTHAMALVGWDRVTLGDAVSIYNEGSLYPNYCQSDSSLIGKEYWIFKDSRYQDPNPVPSMYGSHPGYLHVIFNDDNKFSSMYYVTSTITSLHYTTEDIVCEDLDGDGYYNWGIGQKPSHCPAWAPNEADGDDSEATLGPMDEYGYCDELASNHPVYEYIQNDSILISPENRTTFLGITRGATVTIQAQQTFYNGTKLLLDNGATLIIDATTIIGSSIQPYAGSTIILNNGGKIMKPFNVPTGVELIINWGSIE